MAPDPAADVLERLREICLDLPGTEEKISHGSPTFFVKKVFCTLHDDHHGDGRLAIWCPAAPGVQAEVTEQEPERYYVPPYVGHRGWIGLRLDVDVDWDEVESVVLAAYRLVAPKKRLAELDARG